MRQVEIDDQSELGEFFRSGGTKRPPHRIKPQTFSYKVPELGPGKKRAMARLMTTDLMFGAVQVFTAGGGERVMHSHTAMDGFWFVLGGGVRFHFGDGSSQEFGVHEGVCVPRDLQYWFESTSDEPLQILQVEAIHPNVRSEMVTKATPEEIQESVGGSVMFDALETAKS